MNIQLNYENVGKLIELYYKSKNSVLDVSANCGYEKRSYGDSDKLNVTINLTKEINFGGEQATIEERQLLFDDELSQILDEIMKSEGYHIESGIWFTPDHISFHVNQINNESTKTLTKK